MRERAWRWSLACVFVSAGALAACDSSSGTGGGGASGCTPGAQVSCDCPGGSKGVQVCKNDGSGYDACQCQGSTSSTGASSSSGSPNTCGDGMTQTGECDPASAQYCPADCMSSSSGSGTSSSSSSSSGSSSSSSSSGGGCTGHVYYAGKYDGAPPVWATLPGANGETGLAAGNAQCASLGIGADHVCDYEEVVRADLQGELASLPGGTNAWIQRTTVALVNGQLSQPGIGGRCKDWTDSGNQAADGEYITFPDQGPPTYHLDPDTIYDPNVPGAHTINTDLQCGFTTHSILCCFPSCN